jgi:hypothetical protein
LTLTPAEFSRESPHRVLLQADGLERFVNTGSPFRRGQRNFACSVERISKLDTDSTTGVQRRVRVLKDHL